MELTRELMRIAVGDVVLALAPRSEGALETLEVLAEHWAVEILQKIKTAMSDESLDDYALVDALVQIMNDHGIETFARHDE